MIIDLPDLAKEVNKLWPSCSHIRSNNGKIEFGLPISGRDIAWFPYYRAPHRIEKYIKAWENLTTQ